METILDGLSLMVLGMGAVFIFLFLMVNIIEGMTKFFERFNFAEPETEPKVTKKKAPKSENDKDIITAITKAVNMHIDKTRS